MSLIILSVVEINGKKVCHLTHDKKKKKKTVKLNVIVVELQLYTCTCRCVYIYLCVYLAYCAMKVLSVYV